MEGAGDLTVAGVVVEDGGHALLDRVDVEGGGAGPGAVHHQMAVDGPPRSVQHLVEVGGIVAHNGKTPGQSGIDVGVGVDEGGHDHAALGVDDLRLRVFGSQSGFLADLHDLRALVGHRAVFVVALTLRVAGDEPSVGNKCHNTSPLEKILEI